LFLYFFVISVRVQIQRLAQAVMTTRGWQVMLSLLWAYWCQSQSTKTRNLSHSWRSSSVSLVRH